MGLESPEKLDEYSDIHSAIYYMCKNKKRKKQNVIHRFLLINTDREKAESAIEDLIKEDLIKKKETKKYIILESRKP